jgi:hypothetical protein
MIKIIIITGIVITILGFCFRFLRQKRSCQQQVYTVANKEFEQFCFEYFKNLPFKGPYKDSHEASGHIEYILKKDNLSILFTAQTGKRVCINKMQTFCKKLTSRLIKEGKVAFH